jgi:hypothetical protein
MKIRKNEYLGGLCVGLTLLVVCPSYAAEFYVAVPGRDADGGSLKRPFATLERARDEVRKLIAAGLKENVTVFVRGGTYRLTRTVVFGPADSGTREYTITYAAYPGETPVFSGGVRITGWRRLEDAAAQGTLISENLIYDCAIPAINPGARDNYIENNIMIDVSTRRWPSQTGHFMFGPEAKGRFQRNIVYNSSDSVKFLLNMRGASLGQFEADFNIFYSAGNPAGSAAFVEELMKPAGAQELPPGKTLRHQRTVSADPLFVDPAQKDFRLRPDSPVWKLGFKPIDMAGIGLTADFPVRFR